MAITLVPDALPDTPSIDDFDLDIRITTRPMMDPLKQVFPHMTPAGQTCLITQCLQTPSCFTCTGCSVACQYTEDCTVQECGG